MLKFQGSIKQEVQFLGMLKKSSYGISMGLGFRPYNFQGVSHNFGEVPVVCSGISKGKMTNLKAPVFGVFFRKVYPQLLMDFFGIAQLQLKTLQGQLKPNYHGKSSSFMVPCDLPLQKDEVSNIFISLINGCNISLLPHFSFKADAYNKANWMFFNLDLYFAGAFPKTK